MPRGMAGSSYKHIDVDKIVEVTEGSTELLADMVAIFRRQLPEYTQQLEDLSHTNDGLTLARLAHKIKGSVSLLGISQLVESMQELVKNSQATGVPKDFNEILDQFKLVSSQALEELKDYLGRT